MDAPRALQHDVAAAALVTATTEDERQDKVMNEKTSMIGEGVELRTASGPLPGAAAAHEPRDKCVHVSWLLFLLTVDAD